jgi:hypothetical protein
MLNGSSRVNPPRRKKLKALGRLTKWPTRVAEYVPSG